MNPPTSIDGARVLEWVWSPVPFGYVRSTDTRVSIAIHGLALCMYEGKEQVFRFSCDAQWGTVQDEVYNSLEEAKELLPDQYREVQARWQRTLLRCRTDLSF